MNDKIANRIAEFFNNKLLNKVGDVSIFQNDDGSYELFNRYYITHNSNGYKITLNYNSDEKLFSSLKNAVAWCIFENRKKYQKAQRIEYLDKIIIGIEVNMEIHRRLIKRSKDTETKLIFIAKLSDEQSKRKRLISEIQGYIDESKILQTKKFDAKR